MCACKVVVNQVWQRTPLTPALETQKHEDVKTVASLGLLRDPVSRQNKRNKIIG